MVVARCDRRSPRDGAGGLVSGFGVGDGLERFKVTRGDLDAESHFGEDDRFHQADRAETRSSRCRNSALPFFTLSMISSTFCRVVISASPWVMGGLPAARLPPAFYRGTALFSAYRPISARLRQNPLCLGGGIAVLDSGGVERQRIRPCRPWHALYFRCSARGERVF